MATSAKHLSYIKKYTFMFNQVFDLLKVRAQMTKMPTFVVMSLLLLFLIEESETNLTSGREVTQIRKLVQGQRLLRADLGRPVHLVAAGPGQDGAGWVNINSNIAHVWSTLFDPPKS